MSSLRRRNIPSAKKPSVRFSSRDVVASKSGLAGVRVSSEEADAILQELANHDDDAKKTWSRIFVEQFLSKVRNVERELRSPWDRTRMKWRRSRRIACGFLFFILTTLLFRYFFA
jgi:hypothetical protein